jgi:hypothetical protein
LEHPRPPVAAAGIGAVAGISETGLIITDPFETKVGSCGFCAALGLVSSPFVPYR